MAAVVRITCESSAPQGAVNVWHWRIPNSSALTEVTGCVGALKTFYDAIAGMLATQTISIGTRCVTEDQAPNLIISPTVQTSTGTGTGASPLQCAAVLKLFSNVVGGAHRGRKYIGPLDTASIQANGRLINATDKTTLVSAAATLMAFTTNGVNLVVWSRKNASAQTVTGVGAADVLGTQRRRLI